jgi:class 3 adenylate cyclase
VNAAFAAIRASQADVLRLHVGVHHGSVLRERDAVYGSAVNIASRVCALSSPDEVLVSATSHGLLTKSDAPGIAFVDRGTQRFKGVTDLQRVFAVVPAS